MRVEELISKGLPESYVRVLEAEGITTLNPVQADAVNKGVLEGRNLVVSTPTASGKTLIAEMLLVKTVVNEGIGVYLTPLKALASEKHGEFNRLSRIGLKAGITTGDYDNPAEELRDYDIIVATYERFDSLLRLKPSWISRVKAIVIDEMHTIGDPDRGPIIEMIVARALKAGVQILGLSATIGNPHHLAEWIKGGLVDTPWRPVKLVEGYYSKSLRKIFFDNGVEESVEVNTGDRILDVVLHNLSMDYQTIVFIHNRRKVEEYAEKVSLKLPPTPEEEVEDFVAQLSEDPSSMEREFLTSLLRRGVGYHHAGLSSVGRRVVEEAFRSRVLRIVFATPTLAAGVNLPARRVVVSVKRYDASKGRTVSISVSEYKQMAGRAGRPRYDRVGESIIVDASSDREAVAFLRGRPEEVRGKLASSRNLRIHALSLLASREAASIEGLNDIFSLTFSAYYAGSKTFLESLTGETINYLLKTNMVVEKNGFLEATSLGKITSYTYLDPATVDTWRRIKPPLPSDAYVLHVVTITPDFLRSAPYIPSRIIEEFEEGALEMSRHGIIPSPGRVEADYDDWLASYVYAMILVDWINETPEDAIISKYSIGPGDLFNIKETATWIVSSLAKIESVLGDRRMYRHLQRLSMRLEEGVKEDALELTRVENIGRVRARILIEHGIKSINDLAEAPLEKLSSLPRFGPRVARSVKEWLRKRGYTVKE
ncbi:DEAD/DEAH box helicase [Thermosphaera chiliense]|uniref:ATP-dependent DNA helicase Hel308 n=2 Tax=Thermosphaera chiliense TaxID=3402707 RepID=A0A7M1UVA6_9CREN|nr:DEAD/DEAH box helicase [Thermosphaera aggregans]